MIEPYYLMNREVIKVGDIEFNITTHSVDMTAWRIAYSKGWRAPNHNLPAPYYTEELVNDGQTFRFGLFERKAGNVLKLVGDWPPMPALDGCP